MTGTEHPLLTAMTRVFPHLADCDLDNPETVATLRTELGRAAGRSLFTLFCAAVFFSVGVMTWLWI